jgi:hypothetical protein
MLRHQRAQTGEVQGVRRDAQEPPNQAGAYNSRAQSTNKQQAYQASVLRLPGSSLKKIKLGRESVKILVKDLAVKLAVKVKK